MTTETWKSQVVGRGGTPGITKVGGDAEFVSPQGGGGGTKKSGVGPFRQTMEGHVWDKGEDREVVDDPNEGERAACVSRSSGRGVRPGRRDGYGIIGGGGCRSGRGRDGSRVWRG
jgi:hypothetical protein